MAQRIHDKEVVLNGRSVKNLNLNIRCECRFRIATVMFLMPEPPGVFGVTHVAIRGLIVISIENVVIKAS
jgi:hypothetical protein